MFILKHDERHNLTAATLKHMLKIHTLYAATSDIYYQNARLINGHHKILDLKGYNEYYKNFLNDIELVSQPIDIFVPPEPDENGEATELFMINRIVPEYEKIDARVTYEDMQKTFPPESEVLLKISENPDLMQTLKDDIFIYFCVTKFLQQLDAIRIEDLSEMTPMIEYVVENITLNDIKQHLHTRKISIPKFTQFIRDNIFKGDYGFLKTFYSEPHGDIPEIDIELLMQKLTTNIDIESDNAVIIGMYLTLSFSMADIKNNQIEQSECAKYVRDVLAKV